MTDVFPPSPADQQARDQADETLPRLMLDAIPGLGLLALGPDQRVSYLNAEAARLLTLDRQAVVGLPLRELAAHPVLEWLASVDGPGADGSLEEEISLTDGDTGRWCHLALSCLEQADGQARGSLLSLRDVSGERRVAEKLGQSEERMRLALRVSHEGLWEWRPDTDDSWWNEDNDQLWGSRSPELDSGAQWWADRVHPQDRRRVADSLTAALEDGEQNAWRAAYRFRRENGEYAHVLDRAYIARDEGGHTQRVVGAMLDITEAVRYRNELDRLFELSPEPLCIADTKGFFKRVNPAFPKLLGFSEAELLAKPFLQFIHPDDLAPTLKAMRGLAEGRTVRGFENRYIREDGDICWLQWHAAPDAEGQLSYAVARDVTRQKIAEAELRRYEQIVSASTDLLSFVDRDYIYQAVNDAYLQAHRRVREELVGRRVDEVMGPQVFRDLLQPNLDRCFSGLVVEYEGEFQLQGLGRRYMAVRYQPHRAQDGRVSGAVVSVHDITERRESEQRLADSEARYRELFNRMRSGVAVYQTPDRGESFVFSDINRSGAELGDLPREAIIGRSVEEVFPGVREMGLFEVFQRVWRGGEAERFPQAEYRDHRIAQWLENYVYRLPGGELVAVYDDVSERRRAAEELRVRDRALASTSNGVLITSASGDMPIVYANPAFLSMSGYGREEVIGRNCRFLQGEERQQRGLTELRQALAELRPCTVRLRNYRKDGSLFWNRLSVAPVLGDDGQASHFVGVQEDISGQLRLERELQQAHKMEAIGQLTGGIAHDFNNMLGTMLGFAHLARERLAELPQDKLSGYLERILEAGGRGRDLVSQMLAFSRKEVLEEPAIIELRPVVSEVVSMLGSVLPSSITIEVDLATDALPRVAIDPVRLHQILMNLCVNARDAMHGQGQLTISLSFEEVSGAECEICHQQVTGRWVGLGVADSGDGMDFETRSHIFDPFFTTKAVGEGTGMGLSVVQGIMDTHGGHVLVRARPGQGSRFTLLFPPVSDGGGVQAATDADHASAPAGGGQSILVVDDEASLSEFLVEFLRHSGYRATAVSGGVEALRRIRDGADHWDLLITDQTMPGLTGLDLASRVRECRPDMPIVLYTGHSDQIHGHSARELGVDVCLIKPVEPAELLGILARLLVASGPA